MVNFTRLVEDEGIKSNGQQKMYCLDLLGVFILYFHHCPYTNLCFEKEKKQSLLGWVGAKCAISELRLLTKLYKYDPGNYYIGLGFFNLYRNPRTEREG